MENDTQQVLFADVRLWRRPEPEAPEGPPAGQGLPRLQWINRHQLLLRAVDVEQLIGPDHPARAIGELLGQRDLTRFYDPIEAVEGVAGRPARDPRWLLSLWIYAYLEGTPSAREMAPFIPSAPGVSTSSAPRALRSLRRSTLMVSGIVRMSR